MKFITRSALETYHEFMNEIVFHALAFQQLPTSFSLSRPKDPNLSAGAYQVSRHWRGACVVGAGAVAVLLFSKERNTRE